MTSVTSMMRKVWPNAVAALGAAPSVGKAALPSRFPDTMPNTSGAKPVDIETSVVRTASGAPQPGMHDVQSRRV